MKIAFFVGHFPKLSETFILNQIIELINLGHSVDVFFVHDTPDKRIHSDYFQYNLSKVAQQLDIKSFLKIPDNLWTRRIKGILLAMIYFPRNPLLIIKSLNFLKHKRNTLVNLYLNILSLRFYKRFDHDIVHCHFAFYEFLLIKKSNPKLKTIISIHGGDLPYFQRLLPMQIHNIADRYTYNSDFTRQRMLEIGSPEEKLYKLPESLNLVHFPYSPKILKDNEKIKLLTVGRLVKKKGHEFCIKMLGKLIKKYENIEYQIAGDGPTKESLEQLVESLNLKSYVKFLGEVNAEDCSQLYQESHIFILASVTTNDPDNEEGQALVLQEAQASGLPVISTVHNGIPEGVLNGVTGFLVPESDIDALYEKTSYLIEHPELWPEMGRRGHEFVSQKYDSKKIALKLSELYETILAEKHQTDGKSS